MGKILVTYATRAGSTKEVAEYIGRILAESHLRADVLPVKSVKSVEGYSGVIVGSAIRNAALMSEVFSFVRSNQRPLASVPTAYFVVCLTMQEDTPEHRQTVETYLNPLTAIVQPVSKGLFAGVMDATKLGFPWKTLMKNQPQGDYRRWEEIRRWTEQVIPQFASREMA